MTKILNVDAADNTMTVQAGATLKSVQDAADDAGRLFPLSLASEGSCRIGGNLSTNAGGLNVLAYGNARDLCLGLEVVLPDGRIWNGLRRLRKDNTGYDLKNLFIGAEGTLGRDHRRGAEAFSETAQPRDGIHCCDFAPGGGRSPVVGEGNERQPGGGLRTAAADCHGFHGEAHGDQQSAGGIFPVVCAERTGRSRCRAVLRPFWKRP